MERSHRRTADFAEIVKCILEAVIRQHDIAVQTIALIAPATLPKTTSGKIQRNYTRSLWLAGALDVIG